MIENKNQQINVKDMVCTEPVKRLDRPLDPSTCIDKQEWELAKALLDTSMENLVSLSDPAPVIDNLVMLSILAPDTFRLEDLPDDAQNTIQDYLLVGGRGSEFKGSSTPDDFDMLLLDKSSAALLRINPDQFENIKSDRNWKGLTRVVFPERTLDIGFKFASLVGTIGWNGEEKKVPSRVRDLATARFASPALYAKSVSLSADEWRQFNEEFYAAREKTSTGKDMDIYNFLNYSSYLRIIAADRVEIVNHKLKLTFLTEAGQVTNDNISMPIKRRF